MKHIFAIVGSAASESANEQLVRHLAAQSRDTFRWTIFTALKSLPHFEPELAAGDPPAAVIDFRDKIAQADGILICTPEYVFSLPAGLKNALEWCVATTVFNGKATGLITAAANGAKAHESLQLIMTTLMATCTGATTLLIPGIRGKTVAEGGFAGKETNEALSGFLRAFKELVG